MKSTSALKSFFDLDGGGVSEGARKAVSAAAKEAWGASELLGATEVLGMTEQLGATEVLGAT